MEYVKVKFPTRRRVYIDEEENGYTNEVLRIDAGTHDFELGNLANYRPASRTVTVKDTTVLEPLEIAFYRKEDE
ncbi:MAG: PEGA domain-containing protein [Betaproteobacteria bacterium]|nr:MAG: PEGA domain-containing protein [Betaproteobacteria bacterium]